MTFGDTARSPEASDNNVQVPNMILPVVLALRAHESTIPGAIFQGSTISETLLASANSAPLTSQIITLAPGLWEIEISMTSWFNYNKVSADFNGTAVIFNYQGVNRTLMKRYAATNLSATDFARYRLLLSAVGTLSLNSSTTGVGQALDAQAIVNAIRIL